MAEWPPALGPILIGEERIQNCIRALGQEISRDLHNSQPLVVGVLRGAAIFHADLIRSLDIPLTVDFIALSSYGDATDSSGEVKLVKDLESSIRGADVLLVEDIVDTGLTLNYLLGNLRNRNPNSIRVCSLLSKPSRREVDIPIDYLGFEIPDQFVVGYGLDFNQRYRNLPFVAALEHVES